MNLDGTPPISSAWPCAVMGTCPVATYVNRAAEVGLDVPAGVTTWTETVPEPTGATAVMAVADVTATSDDAWLPKYTAVAPVNPAPEMWIVSPPPAVPLAGVSAPIDTGPVPPTVPVLPAPPPETGACVATGPVAVETGPLAGEP